MSVMFVGFERILHDSLVSVDILGMMAIGRCWVITGKQYEHYPYCLLLNQHHFYSLPNSLLMFLPLMVSLWGKQLGEGERR
jgi:hypothetical protein